MTALRYGFAMVTVAAAGLLFALAAHAQDGAAEFPSRNITLVVPFGAGGPPDSIARVVAAGLSKALGKPVIVENRVGGGSSIAASTVARAPADGHTLLAVDISFTVAPHLATNFPVDPLKDFKPVGQSAKSSFVLIASTSLNTPTLEQFIARAKEKGDEIKIGHTGIGTTPHLAAMTFLNAAKVKPMLVAYRAITEATSNVIAGHISGVFSAASTAMGLARENKAHVLGVTGTARSPALPDVPTFAEKGIQMTGFEAGSWYGVVAPAGTPDSVIAKLNEALRAAASDKETSERLAKVGLELAATSPQEFKEFLATQHRYWGESLRAAGIKARDH